MAGPGEVRTQEAFVQALQQLISATGKSHERIAASAGVSGNTVRNLVPGKNWPQQHTVVLVVRACGQDPKPWVDAWTLLNEARPRPERGGDKKLQEQIDALRAQLSSLEGRVRYLRDALEHGEEGDRRRERRMADAYFAFLAQMPHADFQRIEPSMPQRPSTVLSYAEPAYEWPAVDLLLRQVNELATADGLPKLALHLATSPLPRPVTTVAAYGNSEVGWAYVKSDVDAYVTKLRACVHQYLRDCTEAQLPARSGVGEAGVRDGTANAHSGEGDRFSGEDTHPLG